jgi:hypothetical protein
MMDRWMDGKGEGLWSLLLLVSIGQVFVDVIFLV